LFYGFLEVSNLT